MSKKLKNGCIPARRRISSGGKAGSYADSRTGGKQAHSALMKVRPAGTKKGYFKGAVCCHTCPNDRSAPNGYVCVNPSHLYWGTKGDNTTDQHHGNGTAKNEDNVGSDVKAYMVELIPESNKMITLSRAELRKIILECINRFTF
jgi:hypothetical protein